MNVYIHNYMNSTQVYNLEFLDLIHVDRNFFITKFNNWDLTKHDWNLLILEHGK